MISTIRSIQALGFKDSEGDAKIQTESSRSSHVSNNNSLALLAQGVGCHDLWFEGDDIESEFGLADHIIIAACTP